MELNCNCDFSPICCHNPITKNEEISDGDSAYCIPVFGRVFDFALNPQWGVWLGVQQEHDGWRSIFQRPASHSAHPKLVQKPRKRGP